MDIYVERENQEINFQEWLNYVESDKNLILAEVTEGINPLTKMALKVEIPGRVLFQDMEIYHKKGCIGCEYASEEMLAKLKEIATALGAKVYDCGEEI